MRLPFVQVTWLRLTLVGNFSNCYIRRGCQACKKRKIGYSCRHCLVRGWVWPHCFGMRKECALKPGKRKAATLNMGQGLAEEKKVCHQCNGCDKIFEQSKPFWRCKCCKFVNYCDYKCQRIHWPQHKHCGTPSSKESKIESKRRKTQVRVILSVISCQSNTKR